MTARRSPLVYVVLGVFDPLLPLFERQLRSLLDQTHQAFEVLLVLDGPQAPETRALITTLKDERLVELEFADNVGVHANYARGLNAALARSRNDSDLFAFCDQDDVWHPDKLTQQASLMASSPGCGLCHCDARVVDAAGKAIAPSMFAYERRSKRTGLLDLLVMNSVTGMTCIASKAVARAASDFPLSATPEILHDHWMALVAAAHSEVTFLDQVLVDYVQHGANELGAKSPSTDAVPGRNLIFGGKAYWQRCKRQYAWRVQALEALSRSPDTSGMLADAEIRGWSGGARLLRYMLSTWMAGEARQSAQSWRLLTGKALSP